jgi:hypothetical protein
MLRFMYISTEMFSLQEVSDVACRPTKSCPPLQHGRRHMGTMGGGLVIRTTKIGNDAANWAGSGFHPSSSRIRQDSTDSTQPPAWPDFVVEMQVGRWRWR